MINASQVNSFRSKELIAQLKERLSRRFRKSKYTR